MKNKVQEIIEEKLETILIHCENCYECPNHTNGECIIKEILNLLRSEK